MVVNVNKHKHAWKSILVHVCLDHDLDLASYVVSILFSYVGLLLYMLYMYVCLSVAIFCLCYNVCCYMLFCWYNMLVCCYMFVAVMFSCYNMLVYCYMFGCCYTCVIAISLLLYIC